jgi:hypothetical protein
LPHHDRACAGRNVRTTHQLEEKIPLVEFPIRTAVPSEARFLGIVSAEFVTEELAVWSAPRLYLAMHVRQLLATKRTIRSSVVVASVHRMPPASGPGTDHDKWYRPENDCRTTHLSRKQQLYHWSTLWGNSTLHNDFGNQRKSGMLLDAYIKCRRSFGMQFVLSGFLSRCGQLRQMNVGVCLMAILANVVMKFARESHRWISSRGTLNQCAAMIISHRASTALSPFGHFHLTLVRNRTVWYILLAKAFDKTPSGAFGYCAGRGVCRSGCCCEAGATTFLASRRMNSLRPAYLNPHAGNRAGSITNRAHIVRG